MVLAQVDGIIYDLTLARTVGAWQSEILARHPTASCSNGPTEAIGLRQQEGQAGRPRSSSCSPGLRLRLGRPNLSFPHREPR